MGGKRWKICPLRRGRGQDESVSPAGDPISQRGEMGGKTRRGTSSKHTSLTPFPQNCSTAKTPYRSVASPLQIETVRFDLRRTFRRNLPAATKGSCAIFRRIRTRLRPHWIPHFWTRDGGLRGTMDDVPSPVIARPARRLVVAIRASCPKSAHHAAPPPPSLLCKSVPPRGAFLFSPPKISLRRIVIFAHLLYNSILG